MTKRSKYFLIVVMLLTLLLALPVLGACDFSFGGGSGGSGNNGDSGKLPEEPTYVTVTFHPENDDRFFNGNFEKGKKMTAPAEPTREGYTFLGWSQSADDEESLWDFETQVATGDMHLYAVWQEKTAAVTLDANGGEFTSGETEEVVQMHVSSYNKLYYFSVPVRTGYTFNGWCLKDGKKVTDSSSAVGKWSYEEDTSIYASWGANKYTVEYYLTPQATSKTSGSLEYDSDVAWRIPELTGYTFVGWFDKTTGVKLADEKGKYLENDGKWNRTDDIKVVGHWTPNVYSVTFDSLGGGEFDKQNVTFGETFEFGVPSKVAYTFAGWQTEDGKLLTDKKGVGLSAWSGADDVTLTAKYDPIQYTIQYFNLKKADNSANKTTYTIEDEDFEIQDISTNGYKFTGWTTGGTAADTTIEQGSYGDLNFYANWGAFEIYTADDLRNEVYSYGEYILMNDVDLSGKNWTPIAGWFEGDFNGNGHVISNMRMRYNEDKPDNHRYLGLFEKINTNGVVHDLGIVKFTVYYSGYPDTHKAVYVGGIAGTSNGTVRNCFVEGGEPVSSYSKANVYASNYSVTMVGGIVGYLDKEAEIVQCYTSLKMAAYGSYGGHVYVGGLVGSVINEAKNVKISDCYATGSIIAAIGADSTRYSVYMWVGGLLGGAQNSEVTNCYANVTINATSTNISNNSSVCIGGLIGFREGGKLKNCFAIGNIDTKRESTNGSLPGHAAQGLVGRTLGDSTPAPVNCYRSDSQYVYKINFYVISSDQVGTRTADANLQSETFLKNTLQFSEDIWNFEEDSYPTLKTVPTYTESED